MAVEMTEPTENANVTYNLLVSVQNGDLPAAKSCIAPDCIINEADSLPWGGVWRGPEGFAAMAARIFEFCKVGLNLSVTDAGHVVLAHGTCTFTARKDGKTLEMPMIECHTIRAGRLVYADVFFKDTQAVNQLVATSAK